MGLHDSRRTGLVSTLAFLNPAKKAYSGYWI